MELVRMKIEDLIIPDWYPKQDSEVMMRKLRTSLGEYGYLVPVVVNKLNNHVVSGAKRIEALKDMGETEIDVVFTILKLPEKEIACSLALNKIDFEWDEEKREPHCNTDKCVGCLLCGHVCPVSAISLGKISIKPGRKAKAEDIKL